MIWDWILWVLQGAAVISAVAFCWCLFLSWSLADGNSRFDPAWGWAAHWALIALGGFASALALAYWGRGMPL